MSKEIVSAAIGAATGGRKVDAQVRVKLKGWDYDESWIGQLVPKHTDDIIGVLALTDDDGNTITFFDMDNIEQCAVVPLAS